MGGKQIEFKFNKNDKLNIKRKSNNRVDIKKTKYKKIEFTMLDLSYIVYTLTFDDIKYDPNRPF